VVGFAGGTFGRFWASVAGASIASNNPILAVLMFDKI